jgi:hypothetical protein
VPPVKREKQLTKRERKALKPQRPEQAHQHQHIHCIACGRHLDEHEFTAAPATALMMRCRHGSTFPSCTDCRSMSQNLLDTHDRTGGAVQTADAWH